MIKNMTKLNTYLKKFENKNLLFLAIYNDNLEKIDFIKNQHQFIEMFLIRSIYLKKNKK